MKHVRGMKEILQLINIFLKNLLRLNVAQNLRHKEWIPILCQILPLFKKQIHPFTLAPHWVSIFIELCSCNVSTGEMLGRTRVKAHTQIRLALIRQMWLTWWQLNLAHEGPRRLPAPILRHSTTGSQQNHHSCRYIDHCSWRVWEGLQLSKIHLKTIRKIT